MIPSTDHSYLGSGSILVREYGAAAPLLSLGNCSALTLSPQEDVKNLLDYTQPGGNKRSEVRRLTGVDLSYTFHDFSAENFAIGLRSSASTISAGTATDEEVVAYKGGYVNLAKLATSITEVTNMADSVTYAAGTDYELRDGVLYIPASSTISAVTGGAANIKVTYAYVAQKKVEALVASNKQYELVFIGLNEARSGKRTRIVLHKVSGGVLQEMAVIGEEYGAGQVNGSLLSDSAKTGPGVSQYFTVEFED
ncbi:hypothetical protein CSC62_07555 [Pseudoxanthomonas jiangsuensis]|uniref:phage tail tube protein n=1 Tax=Pseudoxanthomonas jiangsuensis TaxID=619688 RepID=UPI00139158C5|nr:hypothetical protein [Pseudoxanthomonas jiangsuensis]KAF1697992.1 hypothetical protein CSC62_07555 [Pseudoxanthomonas jiangsuensis]